MSRRCQDLGAIEARIVATVVAEPGLTSNGIDRRVPGRRQVVLRLLRVAETRGRVRAVPGPRGAALWFPIVPGDSRGSM